MGLKDARPVNDVALEKTSVPGIFRNSEQTQKSLGGDPTKIAEETKLIWLDEISPRFENKYIKDPKTLGALMTSIQTQGLLQPIRLIGIDSAIEFAEDDEKEFYINAKSNLGKKYVIAAGHRRYEACITLLLDEFLNGWNNDYSDALEAFANNQETIKRAAEESNALYAQKNAEVELKNQGKLATDPDLFVIPEEVITKSMVSRLIRIPSFIDVKVDEERELKLYNDTNLTQRSVTSFEIIANVLDEFKSSGLSEEEIMNKYLDGGERKSYNKAIARYITTTLGVEVSVDMISKCTSVIKTLDKNLLDAIYVGKFTVKDARALTPHYVKLKKYNGKELEEFIDKINDGSYTKIDLNKLINLVKETKPKVKKTIDKAKIIRDLKNIKEGKGDIDKLIKYVKENL